MKKISCGATIEQIIKHYNKHHRCPICGKSYSFNGNNADPLFIGSCCDACNSSYVRMAREWEHAIENKEVFVNGEYGDLLCRVNTLISRNPFPIPEQASHAFDYLKDTQFSERGIEKLSLIAEEGIPDSCLNTAFEYAFICPKCGKHFWSNDEYSEHTCGDCNVPMVRVEFTDDFNGVQEWRCSTEEDGYDYCILVGTGE